MDNIVLSLLVDNTSGVLSRVSGLFSRRGYNIDSVTGSITGAASSDVRHKDPPGTADG